MEVYPVEAFYQEGGLGEGHVGFGRRCTGVSPDPNRERGWFGDVAAGIGILYMARGFGSGFGPIVSRRFMANQTLVPYLLGGVLVISGAFYIAVAASDWTMIILVYVFISHAASGVNWVLSTTML